MYFYAHVIVIAWHAAYLPYQGDNRVDETKEAFFASTERARKAFRRQRHKFVRMLAFSNGQSTPVTRRGDLRIF